MVKPERVQRKRTKGWKMPDNTVYVGRGSKWRNPYPVSERITLDQALSGFDLAVRAGYDLVPGPEEIRNELAGKNLACWCPLDRPCHADLLLQIANGDQA